MPPDALQQAWRAAGLQGLRGSQNRLSIPDRIGFGKGEGVGRVGIEPVFEGGFLFVASLFALGLASWQVLIALLAGICIVQLSRLWPPTST